MRSTGSVLEEKGFVVIENVLTAPQCDEFVAALDGSCAGRANLNNLLGVLPFGQECDDPSEPGPGEFFQAKAKDTPLWHWLIELGALSS